MTASEIEQKIMPFSAYFKQILIIVAESRVSEVRYGRQLQLIFIIPVYQKVLTGKVEHAVIVLRFC